MFELLRIIKHAAYALTPFLCFHTYLKQKNKIKYKNQIKSNQKIHKKTIENTKNNTKNGGDKDSLYVASPFKCCLKPVVMAAILKNGGHFVLKWITYFSERLGSEALVCQI